MERLNWRVRKPLDKHLVDLDLEVESLRPLAWEYGLRNLEGGQFDG